MPDEMDRVQAINEQWLEDCLEEHQRRHPPESPFVKGGLSKAPPFEKGGLGGICIDCETPIPEARRRAVPNCTRCIDCQIDFENRRNL